MGNTALPSVSEQETGHLRRVRSRQQGARRSRGVAVVLVVVSVVVGAAVGASVEVYQATHALPWSLNRPATHPRAIATQLTLTAPSPEGAQFTTPQAPLDSMFAAYYASHHGAAQLGDALTPALAVEGGWMQIFASGALYLADPALSGTGGTTAGGTSGGASQLEHLIETGTVDPATSVVELPLLSLLLASGSQVSVGATGSPLTYADLRAASDPSRRVAAPTWYRANAPTGPDGTFIPVEMRNGLVFGHMVPPAFWTAMNDPRVSPDGWAEDYGRPLTEALLAPATGGAQAGPVVVQLFEHGALIQVAATAPRVLPVGLDYLRTFGPPAMHALAGSAVWSTGAVTLHASPGSDAPTQSSLGENFPMTLEAGTEWVDGALWYKADWQTPLRKGVGWVQASELTLHKPSGVATAGFDALDPGLASYLASLGGRVGADVYDMTHGIAYQYNAGGSFIVASSVKVPIMLALLTQLEAQGRGPNAGEMSLLTTMIENSNNDSAQELYEEIGDASGMAAFMAKVHISGMNPTPGAWGWSTITPQAMVSLLTLLQQGKILTSQDRALALSLMEHVETDQQTGVGSTAPSGAVFAMKDGWVPGPDGLWAVNSSGIVTIGPETYLISVYTKDDDDLGQGWAITEHVCGAVGQLLS